MHPGRKPRPKSTGPAVADVCNRFLESKERAVETGELTRRTFDEYKAVAKRVASEFGRSRAVDDLGADDFASLRNSMARRKQKTVSNREWESARALPLRTEKSAAPAIVMATCSADQTLSRKTVSEVIQCRGE